MYVQINTDNSVENSAEFTGDVVAHVESVFARCEPQLTRIEVHVKDANSEKQGDRDKQCTIEARLSGLKPIVASHDAPTLEAAINGAVEKLERTLDRRLGKLEGVKGRTSYGGDQGI